MESSAQQINSSSFPARLLSAAKTYLWSPLRDTSAGTLLRFVRRHTQRLRNRLNPNAPKGFVYSIDQWIAKDQAHSSLLDNQPRSCAIDVWPAEQNLVYDSRVSSHEQYPFWQRIRWSVFAGAKLYFLPKARVTGREGVVVSRDNRVIREFIFPPRAGAWSELSCFLEPNMKKPVKAVGWYATINYATSYNYFHWMLECLPRMSLLEKFVPILDGVVISENILPFHRDSMALLGIQGAKLIPCSPTLNVEFENLFVPKYFARDNPPRWLHTWYKEKFLGPEMESLAARPRQKLYITRSDAGTRRCENDDEIYGLLAEHGFRRVALAGLPFIEQARLFFCADTIVAHHGAGLANLVFCRPDTKLLEIFSKYWLAPCFFALAHSIGIEYDHVIAERDTTPEYVPGADETVLDSQKAHSYTVHMPSLVEKVRGLV
jgi:hypothetical protein